MPDQLAHIGERLECYHAVYGKPPGLFCCGAPRSVLALGDWAAIRCSGCNWGVSRHGPGSRKSVDLTILYGLLAVPHVSHFGG